MNGIRNKIIKISPINNSTKQDQRKLSVAKKNKQKVNEDNVDIVNIMFFENIGCSIENCPENYSFERQARSGEGKPFLSENTNKSFENSDDPFYEPDCQGRKPKQSKEKENKTLEFSENILDLLEDLTSDVTTQEPLQTIQQESDFSASTGLASETLSQTGFSQTTFEDQTRNVTNSTKTNTKFYKFNI
jgi:hypothetical protein